MWKFFSIFFILKVLNKFNMLVCSTDIVNYLKEMMFVFLFFMSKFAIFVSINLIWEIGIFSFCQSRHIGDFVNQVIH